jgi:hypothetical protein
MDQVILKGTKTIKQNLRERKMQSKVETKKKKKKNSQSKQIQIEFTVSLLRLDQSDSIIII